MKGVNNPRYGKPLSQESKLKVSLHHQKRYNNGLTHAEIYKNIIYPEIVKGRTINEIRQLLPNKNMTPYTIRSIIKKYNNDIDVKSIKTRRFHSKHKPFKLTHKQTNTVWIFNKDEDFF